MAIKYDPILDALREADTSGSSDTASNLGTGVGVFSYKNSGVFYFNSLANSSTIGVSTASGGNITFNLLSIPSALIPDPLNINNLNVYSTASINRLHVNNIQFDLTSGSTTPLEGMLNWNNSLGYLQYGLPGGNVDLAIGMENVLPRRCKNSSGTTMTKGTVVYISSVSGNDPVVSRARANSDATSAFTIGVCAEDIPDGQKGWITTYGVVSGLNLSSYTAGDTVYLSGTTAGEFTKTKPYAPTHYVRIGIVTKATSSGDLYVQVLNGFEMDELHNVSAQSAASGDILRYNSTTNLWEKTGLVTPQSKALISGQFLDSYDATTGLFSSSVFNASNISHNNLSGLQGGTAGEYNHLTNAQVTNLNNQSGTNTGDETKSSIETKLGSATSTNDGYLKAADWTTFNNKQNALGYTPANQTTTISTSAPLSGGGDLSANRTLSISQANTSTDGYLSATDWNTFDGKLTPNSPITGATKTKITYDSKGLVTAGADATTADISDTTNKRYVTDADLTKLSNTSGTNTGDVTVTDSSTIDFTLTGQALTGSVIEGGITHNNLGSLQGGTAGQYNHLTNAQLTVVQNTSGTNTGDQIVPQNSAAVTNNFLTAYNNTTGAFTRARPTWANIDKTTSPINDLSDVVISSPVNSEVLTYEASTNSWKNKSNPVPENILENANHINNSTNGYGGISNGWTDASANPIQGGFPYLEWDAVYDPGATTAFWYLNEASGNAIDGKTGTYTLTDTNTVGASATLGLMDYARSFDGVNKRFSGTVALGNVVGSQTFVAFIRPSSVTGTQHICGWNDGTRNALLYMNGAKVGISVTGLTPSSLVTDVSLEINKWYLVIGSYDTGANELRIFVNGVYKSVSVTGTHVVTTNNIFQIGATNSANHFNGYINAVAHYYQIGWDEEKMLSLFAVSIYKNTKIYRSDTVSEISLYQLLGREQMHRFNSQTVTFSAEVYQTNSSNAKVTIYNGSANYDSNIVTQTGSWWPVTVTFTFASNNAEVYFNLRTSSGAVGPIWYRNIKLNYGNTPIGNNIHNVLDWQKFPRLLMLDIPKMYDGKPYQYEENKWYSWTPTLAPTGASNSFTTEWRFSGKNCTTKGQIISTHATATWTHTLPIYTGTNEVIYTRHIKVQNNAGSVGLGNWVQTTGNSTLANMYSSIANGTWSTTSGAKVAQIEMCEYEID